MAVELRAHGRNRALRRSLFSGEVQIYRPARRTFHFRFVSELLLSGAADSVAHVEPLRRACTRRIDRTRVPRSRLIQNAAAGVNCWIDNLLFNHELVLVV